MDTWQVGIKAEVTDAWTSAVYYAPSNIVYQIMHGASGPCTIGFDIPMSDPFLTQDQFGPWRSEWQLKRNSDIVLQGVITKVEPIPNDRVIVTGTDYLGYLAKRWYPFDYSSFPNANSNHITGVANPFLRGDLLHSGDTAVEIITALIDALNAVDSDTIPFAVTTGGGGLFSLISEYTIIAGDITTMDQHIAKVAGMDASLGFEYYVDENANIVLYADRYDMGPTRYITITDDMIVGIPTWANNGPASTHEVGWGVSHLMCGEFVEPLSKARFRLLEDSIEYGDQYRLQPDADSLATAWGKLKCNPQHDLTLTVYADAMAGLGAFAGVFYKERAGVMVNIDTHMFMPFHRINNFAFRATNLNFNLSNEGDNLVTLTLDQAYLTPGEDN